MYLAFILAVGMNFFSYWFSDKIVLRMYGAQEVSPAEAPQMHQMVEELAREAGIPNRGSTSSRMSLPMPLHGSQPPARRGGGHRRHPALVDPRGA